MVFAAGYGYYHFSGAKTIVNAAHETKKYYQAAKSHIADQAPKDPNQALEWLRQSATSYAVFIPGAKPAMDSAFKDLDTIREKHGDEVDKLVSDAYEDLEDVVSKGDLDLATAQKAWSVLQKYLDRIADIATDSMTQIVENHPQLKEKLGGSMEQLKSYGDKLGPEAKKQVDDTWKQVSDILKGGMGVEAIRKVKKLVEEKVEDMKKLGDKAWKKGMDEAKPYLEKAPKAKELLESNAQDLKAGDFSELWEKVKDAASSGNTDDLEKFVKKKVDKAKKNSGDSGGLDHYIKMIPGGGEIIPKLSQLSEIAQKHGDEAKRIAEETYEEISEVLKRKVGEAEKVANKAKKEAK